MTKADLDMLRRATDTQPRVSPLTILPEVLAPPSTRDYTQTPSYEVPPLRGVAVKFCEVQGFTRLHVARRNVA